MKNNLIKARKNLRQVYLAKYRKYPEKHYQYVDNPVQKEGAMELKTKDVNLPHREAIKLASKQLKDEGFLRSKSK